ncbi:hypothetical protein [Ferrimonas balearica]|uniref:hypothetical protein n=1 Tax=Ferrimonas balearica TaxID=44012 RepID=UPI001C58912B|nr:hypothetical protein [Ferrimonas balearica]MBW3162946.1 hypothetical protein [Ferrimonas balearica]
MRLALGLALLCPISAWAYVGPGTGLSALGSVLAFVAAIVLLLFGFLWYPFKRLLNRKRPQAQPEPATTEADSAAQERSER